MAAHDRKRIGALARGYTEAWCSHDPARVAAHYRPGGTIAINGGGPAGIASRGHFDQAEYDRQLREGAGR